jgi:beta-glucosidase
MNPIFKRLHESDLFQKRLWFRSFKMIPLIAASFNYSWQDPSLSFEERAKSLVSLLTLSEKVDQMVHTSPGIPRLGIPPYNWWSEALHGVAFSGNATVFPQAIGLGASFDPQMVATVYSLVSDEARAKHERYVRLGSYGLFQGLSFWTPNINIFRDPRWGRGQETFGEDPYLTSEMGRAVVKGLQDPGGDKYYKVHACAKHFGVHSGPEAERHKFNVRPSKRDLYQTYLVAFEALVKSGVAEVMCAYNRVFDQPACANDFLSGKLKEWEHKGIVVSDCGAIDDFWTAGAHETHPSAQAASADAVKHGTTVECGQQYLSLVEAVRTGLISEGVITSTVTKLFVERFKLGMFDPPEIVKYRRIGYDVVQSETHRNQALAMAHETIVLLQNDGTLPLAPSARVLVMGPNADSREMQWGNYNGFNWNGTVSILEGIRNRGLSVRYYQGCDLSGDTYLFDMWENVRNSHGGVGYDAEFWPNDQFSGEPSNRRSLDRIRWHDGGEASLAQSGPATYYSARFYGTFNCTKAETLTVQLQWLGFIRVAIGDPGNESFTYNGWNGAMSFPVDFKLGLYPVVIEYVHQEGDGSLNVAIGREQGVDLLEVRRLVGASDVVVFVGGISTASEGEEGNGGDRAAIELPQAQLELLENVKQMGKPVVLVLCAGSAVAFDPSGLNATLAAWYPGEQGGNAVADVLFGVYNPAGRLPVTFYRRTADLPAFTDYNMTNRTYRYFAGEVLYPFGHGLSYTNFSYSNLNTSQEVTVGARVSISFELRNTGGRNGDEVIQLYVTPHRPGEPIKSLKWFQRRYMARQSTTVITAELDASAFNVFDESDNKLRPMIGAYAICVGGSSADKALLCQDVTLINQKKSKAVLVIIIAVVSSVIVVGVVIVISAACCKRRPARPHVERLP